MTLFGVFMDAERIASLVGLLAMIALWLVIWRRERGDLRLFRDWEARRRARKAVEDEKAGDRSEPGRTDSGPGHGGPWG